MNKYKKPLLAFFLMIIIQLVVSIVMVVPFILIQSVKRISTGEMPDAASMMNDEPMIISLALIASSLITIFILQKPMNMIVLKDSFRMPTLPIGKIVFLVLISFVGIFGIDVLSEVMDLPNIIGDQLNGMSMTVLGVLAIAIVGPLAEEVCFRGSIQQYIHKHGDSPLRAILITSILFGLVHMNPAQIPFAMCVGAILGVFYWKTGSLVLPCIIHMINNGVSCLLSDLGTESDPSLVELLGGTPIALCVSIICIAVCAWVLYKFGQEPCDTEVKPDETVVIESQKLTVE